MIQRLPFRYPATAADVARLQVLLRGALAAIRFHRPGKLAVLNLACGRADETGALAAALSPAPIGHYLGIDLRPDTVAEAARRWELPGGLIEFRSGDASSVDRMKQLPAFDLIFIRHQNYWHDPATWDRLLGNTLGALAPGGVLACTSYFDREHELLKASLKTRGARMLWDVRHAASRPLPDAPGKSVDRHLAVFGTAAAGGEV
ncbi:MAG: class I SAM-dependent methyltransferase [Verrucomicrobiota bacterium]